MTDNKDYELYKGVLIQDSSSLEKLYDRYEKLLYSFVQRMTNDSQLSEEVIQEVFMKLWKGHSAYSEEKGKFSSWLLTMTRNTALDLIRKRKNETSLEFIDKDSLEADTYTPEDELEWKEKNIMIRTAVSTLNEEQKKIVDLFYFKGLTQQKIAEASQLPLGTVKGRLRLALKHLRNHFDSEGGKRI